MTFSVYTMARTTQLCCIARFPCSTALRYHKHCNSQSTGVYCFEAEQILTLSLRRHTKPATAGQQPTQLLPIARSALLSRLMRLAGRCCLKRDQMQEQVAMQALWQTPNMAQVTSAWGWEEEEWEEEEAE